MKVGKAIYNILSQSSDVQSNFPFNTTDYAPTGTELVTNGDFSAGVEKILNGSFDTDLSSWTISGADATHSITWSAGSARYQSGTTSPTLLFYQDALEVGKSYVLTVNITYTSGLLRLGSGIPSTDLVEGLNTLYFVASGVSASFLRGGTNVDCLIDNVSFKELGEGWTLGTGWSIGDSEAISDTTNTVITQTLMPADKYVKITATVGESPSLLVFSLSSFEGTTAERTLLNGTNTYYLKAKNTVFSIANAGADACTITGISVQEMILTKIFPELAPPDIDAPYIVYSVVSNSPSETKNANGDIDTANIEVYGFQDTYNKAVDLGVSVRAALDRKTGTYNTIEIQSTNYVNEQMDVNEARKLWAAIQDYSIRIKNI